MHSRLRRGVAAVVVASAVALCLAAEGRLTTGSYHAKTSYSGKVQRHKTNGFSKFAGRISYGSTTWWVDQYGWARFDLDAIPDDATITDTQLRLYQYASFSYMTIGFTQQSMVDFGTCFDWRSGPGDRACLYKDVLSAIFRMFPGDAPSQLVDS